MFKDLKFFILQYKVKKLYRDFMKTVYQTKNEEVRREMVQLIKDEFLRNKDVKSADKVEYLVAVGRQRMGYVRSLIDMQT